MTQASKISVIVPSYNHAHTLKAAVDSVIHQNIENIEIMIINDGSTDNTHEVVKLIDDSRITYITNAKNLGVNPTINKGFRNAQGQYVCVLAADDMLPPDSLKLRIELMKSKNLDAVHGGTTILQSKIKRYIKPLDTSQASNVVNFLKQGSNTHGINNATFMYNKRVFKKIGYRTETLDYFPHNDFEFALRTLLNCNVGFLDHPVYIYELRQSSHSELYAKNDIALQKSKSLKALYAKHFLAKYQIESNI